VFRALKLYNYIYKIKSPCAEKRIDYGSGAEKIAGRCGLVADKMQPFGAAKG